MRLVAQRSSEDEVHILAFRPISQWTLCGVVAGHDWLVRPEDPKNFSRLSLVCGACKRAFWKLIREDARLVPVAEEEPGFLRATWNRIRSTLSGVANASETDERK